MDNSLETEEQRVKRINDELDKRVFSYLRNRGGKDVATHNGGIESTEFVPFQRSNRGRDD